MCHILRGIDHDWHEVAFSHFKGGLWAKNLGASPDGLGNGLQPGFALKKAHNLGAEVLQS